MSPLVYGGVASVVRSTTGNFTFAVCSTFAICSKLGTRQRPSLPCAVRETHGKDKAHGENILCRVARRRAHGEHKAHGEYRHLPCAPQNNTRRTQKHMANLPSQMSCVHVSLRGT
jgi:hypothetical protein